MAVIVSLCLLCSLATTVSATGGDSQESVYIVDMLSNEEFVEQQNARMKMEYPLDEKHTELAKVAELVKQNGYLTADAFGYAVVSSDIYELGNKEVCDQYIDNISSMNGLLDLGLLSFNTETLEFKDTALEFINNSSSGLLPEQIFPEEIPEVNTPDVYGWCGCPYENIYLGNLCTSNYYHMITTYQNAAAMGLNAHLTTAVFWVDKVKSGGLWDYKVQPNFSPYSKQWCAKTGLNNWKYPYHVNSEYIGNYNYGFTGRFIFSLDMLHFGSSAVSGFDPADQADWPAIDEGFRDAGDMMDQSV